jgi:hypothetical protein
MSTSICSCVSTLTNCSSTSKYFVDPLNSNKYCVPSCSSSVTSSLNPTVNIFQFTDVNECKVNCSLHTMDYRCVSACDVTPSDSTYAFLYVNTGSNISGWGNFYPVCVNDCFYTPKKFYYLNGGVETCDTFPKASYYLDLNTNLLTTTACTLYKADDLRCTSTCGGLNTAKTFDPYGTTGSSNLVSASGTHLQRNDPECVPSCQGLSPAKLTYTDSNTDVSCTSSCPPSIRIPSGSHLSVQDGTNCQDTCTTVATPVFELQSGKKICIDACRNSVQSPPNHF